LAEERQRFLAHCAEQRMAPNTLLEIAYCLLHVATALRLAERPGEPITRAEIEAVADRWASRRGHQPALRAASSSLRRFIRYATRWLSFLGRLQPPVPVAQPHADLVARFADYMRQERGLSPHTIAGRCRAVGELLAQLPQASLRLDTLTAAQVDDLLARKAREGGYACVTVRAFAYCLRAFFRFAEACACCRPGLAAAVTAPRVYRDEAILAGPSWEDVQRLLATAQGDRPTDLRARSVLLLLATYGLRAGELVGCAWRTSIGSGNYLRSPTASASGPGPTRCAVPSAMPSSATCGKHAPTPSGGRCSLTCVRRSAP
jgi:site-specific recombinase XerD